MSKRKNSSGFKGHRFPSESVEYAVWLYFRFSLSLRDIEDIFTERVYMLATGLSCFRSVNLAASMPLRSGKIALRLAINGI